MVEDRTALAPRAGLKWNQFPDDVLAAWVAEMDFGLAPSVATALREAIERGDTGYPYPALEREAAAAATDFWSDTLNWEVAPERVFSAPDVIEGLRRAIVHLTRPNSPVILHTPVYYPFFSMVERAGRDLIEVPSIRDDRGRHGLDIDGMRRAFEEGAGSIVLCNPWNPTGRCFDADEIGRLVEVVRAHDGRILADEVHAPLTYADATHTAAATVDSRTVVTVTSASKAWNIPGLKCAQVVLTADEDAERWSSFFTPEKVGVSTFGLIANSAAYAGGRAWLVEVRERLAVNRSLLTELLAAHLPAVGYVPPEGTYLAWLDFSAHGLTDPAAYLLEHARVALTDGGPFGGPGTGHARLNFATDPDTLTEIVERLAAALP